MSDTKLFSLHDLKSVATEESVDFAIARIAVLSTAPNSHKINITEEILKRDVPSILGKFVVADYNKYKKDVTTHVPSEFIQGYIPSDQEVNFVRDENGYLVAYVDAVISKIYATEVYNLFVEDNFRNASVEMMTEGDKEREDGTIDIDKLTIFGITILGKNVKGSCPSANIEIIQFSEKDAKDYYTKEKALKLAEDLKAFAQSLDNKDNNNTKETEMADIKELSEDVENKDVVMEENKDADNSDVKEDESKDKEMAEPTTEEMSEDDKVDDEAKDVDKVEDEKTDETDMSCGGKEEMSCTEEMGCGEEKEFSLEQFASEELIKSFEDEVIGEFVKMSADDVIKKFVEILNENKELKEFQTKAFEAEKIEKVNAILAEVKDDLDPKQFEELAEESKEVELSDITAFANKVKAFAYEASKNKAEEPKEDNGVMLMASADDNVTVDDGDVFARLSKKYK